MKKTAWALALFLASCSSSVPPPAFYPTENVEREEQADQPAALTLEEAAGNVVDLRVEGIYNICPRSPIAVQDSGFLLNLSNSQYVIASNISGDLTETVRTYIDGEAEELGEQTILINNQPAEVVLFNQDLGYSLFRPNHSRDNPVLSIQNTRSTSQLRPGSKVYLVGYSVFERFISEGEIIDPRSLDIQPNGDEFFFYTPNFSRGGAVFYEDEQGAISLIGMYRDRRGNLNRAVRIESIIEDIENRI